MRDSCLQTVRATSNLKLQLQPTAVQLYLYRFFCIDQQVNHGQVSSCMWFDHQHFIKLYSNPKLFTSVEFRKLNTEAPSGRSCFQREESTEKTTGRSSVILSIISISFLCKGTRFSKTSWLRGENIGTLTLDVVTWRHGDITSRFSDFRLQLSELNCLVSAKNGQTSSKDVKTCQRFQIVLFLLSKQLPASSFASWPKKK